ncbi:hypothetical protein HZA57_08040, partial [Candidatus Poribacteria bacterium]|nr:hypothetical protein [Candidatus Poribacteria bacterium]
MTQVSPFLKPPAAAPVRGGPDTIERDALRVPKLPVAGFWRRLGALAFDLIMIYTFFRIRAAAFAKPLLELGETASMGA